MHTCSTYANNRIYERAKGKSRFLRQKVDLYAKIHGFVYKHFANISQRIKITRKVYTFAKLIIKNDRLCRTETATK